MKKADKKKRLGIIFLLMCLSLDAKAQGNSSSRVLALHNSAPEEFRQLFISKEKNVSIVLINGESLPVNAMMSDYQVSIVSETSQQEIYDFLVNNNISKKIADDVNDSFVRGMDSYSCNGSKETCQVTLPEGEMFAVVIDNNADKVRLILSEQAYVQETGEVEYVSNYNDRLSLINSPSLYSSYFGEQWNYNLNNRTILGLPFGHIRNELYVTSNSGKQDVSVPEFLYDLESGPLRLLAGRSQNFNTLNSTSLLSIASLHKEGVYLSSSRNLARRGRESYQRLYFYVPQAGAVEIWRENTLIYSEPMEAGQQFINYEKLPVGNYSVTVKVKSGDNVLSEQFERIINTPDFQLNTGSTDFSLGVARTSSDNANGPEMEMAEGDVVWRLWNPLQIGMGITYAAGQQLLKVGGKWLVTPSLTVSGVSSVFSDGRYYNTASVNWKNFNLNWSRYEAGQHVDNKGSRLSADTQKANTPRVLSETLLGNSSYEQIMISSHAGFGPGNSHLSLFYQRNNSESGSYSNSIGYNAGYNMPFVYNSNLGVNISSNIYKNTTPDGRGSKTDNIHIGINFSMPLGRDTSVQISPRWNKGSQSVTDATLQYNFLNGERSNGSLSVGESFGGKNQQRKVGTSLSTRQKSFNFNGNATMQPQSGGQNSMFATLSGSQILNRHGFWLSNSAAESYLIVNDSTPEEVRERLIMKEQGSKSNVRPHAQLTLKKDDKILSNQDYFAQGGDKVIPLEKYKQWNARLQSSAFGVHNTESDQAQGFSLPGSTLYIKTDYQPEYQIIAEIYDNRGFPADKIECQGGSCLKVDKLEDGLFKVFLKGKDFFRLVSSDMLCLQESNVNLTQPLTRLYGVKCETLHSGSGQRLLAKDSPSLKRPAVAHLSNSRSKDKNIPDEVSSSFGVLSSLLKDKRKQPNYSAVKLMESWRFGVFRSYENALRLSDQLEKAGMSVRITQMQSEAYAVYGTLNEKLTPQQRQLINKYGAMKQPVATGNSITNVAMN
ncbi:TcfC E-set like domain-containing protein [Hafnia paralvei]|uniref:TcfC E-set like domain-containing protein n=1 Tax=Hafnia paralvei TaxID=546367 RepID=UPI001CC9158F|nr:TcfC E-set like domain-containing protein [Hafnia paralvei]UBM39788.1 TcfC E-set like domain-containing protein [Hafnia paralvei]